jgi:hypothetical protein
LLLLLADGLRIARLCNVLLLLLLHCPRRDRCLLLPRLARCMRPWRSIMRVGTDLGRSCALGAPIAALRAVEAVISNAESCRQLPGHQARGQRAQLRAAQC